MENGDVQQAGRYVFHYLRLFVINNEIFVCVFMYARFNTLYYISMYVKPYK